MRIWLLCLFWLLSSAFWAQSISNIRVQQDPELGYYTIDFDLNGRAGENYVIALKPFKGKREIAKPSFAKGAGISNACTAGSNKSILWFPHLEGVEKDGWEFKLSAKIHDGFIYVHGGTFSNGTSNVTVSSFYMDKYELTQSGYQAVMGTNPSYFASVPNGPVEQVSWFNAIEYCNRRSMQEGLTPCYSYSGYGTNPSSWPAGWNTSSSNHTNVNCNWSADGYRLPTEMEWMFAAKGGNQSQGYTYSGSNDINAVAWYTSNAGSTTHAVGTKAGNELGLYDMSGNVWEWVWDIYGDYPSGSQDNPTGANSGSDRVRRGGSWNYDAFYCAVSCRSGSNATFSYSGLGFRCVRVSP